MDFANGSTGNAQASFDANRTSITYASGGTVFSIELNQFGIETSGTITPIASGTDGFGTASLPFADVFTDSINGVARTTVVEYEVPTGLVNGVNKNFAFANTPANNSLILTDNGTIQMPSGLGISSESYDIISGTVASFITAPISGNVIVGVRYEYLP